MAKMGATSKVTDVRKFRGDIYKIFGTRDAGVRVGVFADATSKEGVSGSDPAKRTVTIGEGDDARKGEVIDDRLTLLDLAAIHELGLGNVPERSFLRAYVDEQGERLRAMLAALMTAEIARTVQSGAPIDDGKRRAILTKLGLRMVAEIQARMSAGIAPDLQPATVQRKGSSTPLIDTGQLRSGITFQVDLGIDLPRGGG